MTSVAAVAPAVLWFRAERRGSPARYFKASDAALARSIAKCALETKSDAGLLIAEVDPDEQPELISSGVIVDYTNTVDGAVTLKLRIEIFYARSF